MPVDIFLKMDGITGESRDKGHSGEIDVLAWSWGMAHPVGVHAGHAPTGRASLDDLHLTKFVDRASPALMTKCLQSTPVKSATLTCRKAGGSPLEFLKIELTDVIVLALAPAGSHGDTQFTEELTLNFSKVKVTYQEQDEKGHAKGGTVEFEHDLTGKK